MDPTPAAHLHIRPWDDPVVDTVGHDPRSSYVERFWLGILGPSTTWFLRLVAGHLDAQPEGYALDLRLAARTLGLGPAGGSHSPLRRAVRRAEQFGMARTWGVDRLDVRRRVPPLTRAQVARLPRPLRADHRHWQEAQAHADTVEATRSRARRLAMSLLETGHDPEAVERELHRWRYHPALASEATTWACERHRTAHRVATAQAAAPAPEAG